MTENVLREARLNRRYSVDVMSKRLGITKQRYYQYESSDRLTVRNIATLVNLARVLDLPDGHFFNSIVADLQSNGSLIERRKYGGEQSP